MKNGLGSSMSVTSVSSIISSDPSSWSSSMSSENVGCVGWRGEGEGGGRRGGREDGEVGGGAAEIKGCNETDSA